MKTYKQLLLLSNSICYGQKYLEHAENEIKEFLSNTRDVLFVPYAVHNYAEYARMACGTLEGFGCVAQSIHAVPNPKKAIEQASALFIGGGNTFRLLNTLCSLGLMDVIRQRVLEEGMRYIGASAGSNIACPTIQTTNDMPIVYPPQFDALNLVTFNINPHYIDSDLQSTHMGETREKRIREFLEENDAIVIGLREGGVLRIEGDTVSLRGTGGACIFRRGKEPMKYEPGCDLPV